MNHYDKLYDAQYFERGVQLRKSNYHDYSWERLGPYFERTAQHIMRHFAPATALDVGCAKGFLVYALAKLGVDARGIDASSYAVGAAPAEVRERLAVALAQDLPFPARAFDLVTAFDVLEHIERQDVPRVLSELARVAGRWVAARTVTRVEPGDLDAFHATIRPKDWWEAKFREAGMEPVDIAPYVDPGVWWFNVPEYLIIARIADHAPEPWKLRKPTKKVK